MNKIIWEIPIHTTSEANCTEHYHVKSKRHRQQQFFVRAIFRKEGSSINIPCVVKFIRLSSRFLDDDNLRTAFKWIRDELSECLIPDKRKSYMNKRGKLTAIKGRADSDDRITWQYEQEKNKRMSIRIEISFSSVLPHQDIAHE